MTDPIVTKPNPLYNWIIAIIERAADEAELFDYAHIDNVATVDFDVLRSVIPAQLWELGAAMREAERQLSYADIGIAQVVISLLEHADTLEEVERTETILRRWFQVMWLGEAIEVGGLEYLHYRAVTRREEILAGIPYVEYLRSEHWRERRKGAMERAGHRCQVCNSSGPLDVHHRTYARRGCELPEDLTVLCRKCHETFHKNGRLAR